MEPTARVLLCAAAHRRRYTGKKKQIESSLASADIGLGLIGGVHSNCSFLAGLASLGGRSRLRQVRASFGRLARSGARRAHCRAFSGDLLAFRLRLLLTAVGAPLQALSDILFLAGA